VREVELALLETWCTGAGLKSTQFADGTNHRYNALNPDHLWTEPQLDLGGTAEEGATK